MKEKLIGALTIDQKMYEMLKTDEKATTQALIVVLIAAIFSALGGGLLSSSIAVGFISLLVWAVVSWLLWAGATYVIGVKLFKGEANMNQIMRALGFAYAPAAFNFFGFLSRFGYLSLIGYLVHFLVACWLIVSFYMAIKTTLNLEEGSKAAITMIIGWFIYLVGLGITINFITNL